jgi:hypothetical protein
MIPGAARNDPPSACLRLLALVAGRRQGQA